MRIALLSDIHANLQALETCLDHAHRRGAERFVFLGDLVGYGADAAAVVSIVATHAAAGAIVIQGNHDEAVAAKNGYYNDAALAALEHARRTLSADQRAFLATLPLVRRERSSCYVHASAARPERWDYVDCAAAAARSVGAADAVHTFCGHVHDQVLYFESAAGRMSAFRPVPGTAIPVRGRRRWLAVVGSVGQPRDRNPAAAYTMFDEEQEQLTFHRVPYDARRAANRIRGVGLPESLAFRVELGI